MANKKKNHKYFDINWMDKKKKIVKIGKVLNKNESEILNWDEKLNDSVLLKWRIYFGWSEHNGKRVSLSK